MRLTRPELCWCATQTVGVKTLLYPARCSLFTVRPVCVPVQWPSEHLLYFHYITLHPYLLYLIFCIAHQHCNLWHSAVRTFKIWQSQTVWRNSSELCMIICCAKLIRLQALVIWRLISGRPFSSVSKDCSAIALNPSLLPLESVADQLFLWRVWLIEKAAARLCPGGWQLFMA